MRPIYYSSIYLPVSTLLPRLTQALTPICHQLCPPPNEDTPYPCRLRRFPTAQGSSGHRLFITAFMISSRVICDDTYSNKSWSIVGRGMFQLWEVNRMERETCRRRGITHASRRAYFFSFYTDYLYRSTFFSHQLLTHYQYYFLCQSALFLSS